MRAGAPLAITGRQLATVLAACFNGWGDISPRSIVLVAAGMAGDEAIEDDDARFDSLAMALVLDDAASWINAIVSAPGPRVD